MLNYLFFHGRFYVNNMQIMWWSSSCSNFRSANAVARAPLLTSHHDGGRFFGRVSHVVAGHAAVDASLVRGDGGQRERATVHHASLGQAVVGAHPGEDGWRLTSRVDAHQGDRLTRIHHDGVFHQQLNGWRGYKGRKAPCMVFHCAIATFFEGLSILVPVLLVSLKTTLRSGIPHTFLTEAMQL